MSEQIKLTACIPENATGRRFDQVLAELFSAYSRSRLQQWVREGAALLDDRVVAPKYRVSGGERVEIRALLSEDSEILPQAIPLDIRYEDAELLVINKSAGLVVHPAAGNRDGTLQNALLHYDAGQAALPRAGIVHRLDKDTSGLMVVARKLSAHKSLVEQLQARTVHREYLALVQGRVTASGNVDAPIGRHPRDRLRMAVVESGKPAMTHYRVLERFPAHTLIEARLETGRTHQIRVHMASIHYPLVGDPLYGGRFRLPAGASEPLVETLRKFRRQALHARRLELIHPHSGNLVGWEAELPVDFENLLSALRES
ncbi:Ribosomal large subunit pseudouridine synthase D [hydrothermal vent metagenome]|uniref:Ribosomal large subunit pseudouridine synthase D n=1 Tax=hydrothermal vent metagenome TaxID=652676 RepID=A0A3B0XZG6_9ZZZZ